MQTIKHLVNLIQTVNTIVTHIITQPWQWCL